MKKEELSVTELRKFAEDIIHRVNVHETLWMSEVAHQLGYEKALDAMDYVWPRLQEISRKRLAEFSGITMDRMEREQLSLYIDAVAKNWLAQDGLWFQAIEFTEGMNDAKRCNDSTWQKFSPFEAHSIKNLLNMGKYPGLDGLKEAFGYRIYSRFNIQSAQLYDDCLVFTMNDCRVQSARKRKGLDDYPCKSAGLVEYKAFAKGIDERIKTECICCPPDEHDDSCYCKWKFTIEE